MERHALIEYMSHQTLAVRRWGVETVFAAFTDNVVLCLRIKLEAPLLQRGWALWKMNTKL